MTELFEKGGIMMYPILIASVVAIAVILERIYILYYKKRIIEESVIDDVIHYTDKGCIDEALELVKSQDSVYANYYVSILEQTEPEQMERMAVSEGDDLLFDLSRRLNVLSITASVLPLMGLLGTVLGMITVFSRVAHAGDAADITLLAGGIWEALLTTAAGMAVAIPVMLLYHLFKRSIEKRAHSMSRNGDRIIASLRKGS